MASTQDFQNKAQATWEAVTQAVREKFDELAQTCSARLDVAKEGKNLLDSGGERVEKTVLAKQSSLDAAALDADLVKRVQQSIALLEATAGKLRQTEDGQSFAVAYEARAEAYRQLAALLQKPLPRPDMSAAEADAVKILQVKEGCKHLGARAKEGIQGGTQRIVASVKQATGSAAAPGAVVAEGNNAAGQASSPTARPGLPRAAKPGLCGGACP